MEAEPKPKVSRIRHVLLFISSSSSSSLYYCGCSRMRLDYHLEATCWWIVIVSVEEDYPNFPRTHTQCSKRKQCQCFSGPADDTPEDRWRHEKVGKKKKKVQSVFPVTARACDRSFLQSDSAPGTSAFRAQMISCEENKEVVEEGRSREPERRHEQEWK